MSFIQRTRPDCKIQIFYTTGRQKKIDHFSVDEFCSHCNTVFEAMGCFFHFCPCQELRPSLTEEDIKRGSRKRELDELRRCDIQEKGFTVIEMWECGGDFTRQAPMLNYIFQKTTVQTVTYRSPTHRRDNERKPI